MWHASPNAFKGSFTMDLIDDSALSPSAGERKVNGSLSRSLSCWPTVLLSHYATYSDTVKAATTHFELALDVVKLSTISVQTTYLHWNVHYNCSCYLVYQLVVSCYMAQLFWWSILIIGFIRRLMKSTFPYFISWNVNIIWFLYSSVTTNWTLLHWVVDTEWHL